jgi:hypothetical protein
LLDELLNRKRMSEHKYEVEKKEYERKVELRKKRVFTFLDEQNKKQKL